MITGSFSLYGIEDLYAYTIDLSTGDSIPVGVDGKAKSDVIVRFYRRTSVDGMGNYVAGFVYIDISGSDGNTVIEAEYTNRSSIDITDLINQSEGPQSVTVQIYNEPNGVMLQSRTVSIDRDDDIYEIRSDEGDMLRFTYNATPKNLSKLISYQNGLECNASWDIDVKESLNKIYEIIDGHASYIDISAMLFSNVIYGLKKAPTSIDVTITVNNVKTSKSFTIVYDSPVYIAGQSPWSSSNQYRNGEYIEYEGVIYLWSYPISGNSSTNPKDDLSQNPLTTKWKSYQIWDLLATRVFLADFALVGQAVFSGNYMISQQGVDSQGNISSDYREFGDGDFKPNVVIDFVKGSSILNESQINGSIRQPEILLGTYLDEDGTTRYKDLNGQVWVSGRKYDNIMFDSNSPSRYGNIINNFSNSPIPQNVNGVQLIAGKTYYLNMGYAASTESQKPYEELDPLCDWFYGDQNDIGRKVRLIHLPTYTNYDDFYNLDNIPFLVLGAPTYLGGNDIKVFRFYDPDIAPGTPGRYNNLLVLRNEIVELYGYGANGVFRGWIVTNRVKFNT